MSYMLNIGQSSEAAYFIMINWQYYPKSDSAPEHMLNLIDVFKQNEVTIDSAHNTLQSPAVLSILEGGLLEKGFEVEKSKKAKDKIRVPVLFGRNGRHEKSFEVDAYQKGTNTILEVEAGRAVSNYQFLKDLFEACMMHNVDYLAIAVRKIYKQSSDFEKVITHFDTLYASGRLILPLKGVLIIGY